MDKAHRKIRTLIVDDEPLAQQSLRILLKRDPDIDIIGECLSGRAAIKIIKEKKPDLVFLDIQMPEITGFDVLQEIGLDQIPAVIFVTAYDQYAINAFDVHAIDYLLKPFKNSRFESALLRAKRHLEQREDSHLKKRLLALLDGKDDQQLNAPEEPKFIRQIAVKSDNRVLLVGVDDIDWIGGADYYVELHVKGKTYMLRETMIELERKLDPEKFPRIHRSTIVNARKVKEIRMRAGGYYVLSLIDGTELKLSRRRRQQIDGLLNPLP
jgi:two-component system LytT family response regulator